MFRLLTNVEEEKLAKRLMDILRGIAREVIEESYDADDVIKKINVIDIDFLSLKDELMAMELLKYMDEAELDTIRALLSYILMRETELDPDEIYSFIFGKGRHINWN